MKKVLRLSDAVRNFSDNYTYIIHTNTGERETYIDLLINNVLELFITLPLRRYPSFDTLQDLSDSRTLYPESSSIYWQNIYS